MTLIALGLDALDYRLVEMFNCEALNLSNSAPLDSVAYSMEFPLTTEVWPTIATGLHPREHGITKSGASAWDNPLVAIASHLLEPLPHDVRIRLGDVAEDVFGAEYSVKETDATSVFEGDMREVHNWPGVHNSYFIRDRWGAVEKPTENPEYSAAQFDRDVLPVGAEKFGWVEEILNHEVELAGVHLHVIDLAGHVYSNEKEDYRKYYNWMNDRVDRLHSNLKSEDELIIMSDHGMGVSWIEGDEPGKHSSRAFISSTIDDELPKTVFQVRDWIEQHIEPIDPLDSKQIHVDEDHLDDLGYI